MYNTRTKERLADVATVALGTVLFVSPWIIGYRAEMNASWDAWLSGMAVATLGLSALALYAEWKMWANFALGIWIGLAPWILAFYPSAAASSVHHTIGCAVAWIAAARLWLGQYRHPHATT